MYEHLLWFQNLKIQKPHLLTTLHNICLYLFYSFTPTKLSLWHHEAISCWNHIYFCSLSVNSSIYFSYSQKLFLIFTILHYLLIKPSNCCYRAYFELLWPSFLVAREAFLTIISNLPVLQVWPLSVFIFQDFAPSVIFSQIPIFLLSTGHINWWFPGF